MGVSSATARPMPSSQDPVEASSSAVSWAAIFGGAVVAVALSIILLALGSGLGLASVSPWKDAGVSAKSAVALTGIWLIVIQWVSSGMGGYVTGRLRTKWVGVHTHEVFFRDTAHGFLTWATASIAVVTIASSSATSLVSGGAHMASNVAAGAALGAGQGAAQSSSSSGPAPYDIDTLFRTETTNSNASTQDFRGETARILATGVGGSDISANDRTYLAQLVAAHTGVSQADAEKRVDDVIAKEKAAEVKAKQVADDARKAAASLSIFTFLSMLVGAFIACVAGALGGKQRDEY